MAEMKTLTINGKTYVVADPDAGTANIDDSKVGADAWSSKNIVESLAPAFSESGAVVTCTPVEGYLLGVVSQITPVQEGSGDPSPDNVRPITGWTGARLTHGNETQTREFSLDFGETVYGGSLDWNTGVLTVDMFCGVINANNLSANPSTTSYAWTTTTDQGFPTPMGNAIYRRYSDKLRPILNMPNNDGEYNYSIAIYDNKIMRFQIEPYMALADVKAWLSENPVTVCYPIAEPYTIQLTPQDILALSGSNTLYSDTGDTQVSGRADPTAVIEKLTNAIIALGGNI